MDDPEDRVRGLVTRARMQRERDVDLGLRHLEQCRPLLRRRSGWDVQRRQAWVARWKAEKAHLLRRKGLPGDQTEALRLATEALRFSEGHGDPVLHAIALRERCAFAPVPTHARGDLERAVAALEKWLKAHGGTSAPDEWAMPPGRLLGQVCRGLDRVLSSQGVVEERVTWLRHVTASRFTSDAQKSYSVRTLEGLYHRARRPKDAARVVAWASDGRFNLGEYETYTIEYLRCVRAQREGRWSEATGHAVRAYEAAPTKITKGNAANVAAYCHLERADPESLRKAREFTRAASKIWRSTPGSVTGQGNTARRHAALLGTRGRRRDALRTLTESITGLRAMPWRAAQSWVALMNEVTALSAPVSGPPPVLRHGDLTVGIHRRTVALGNLRQLVGAAREATSSSSQLLRGQVVLAHARLLATRVMRPAPGEVERVLGEIRSDITWARNSERWGRAAIGHFIVAQLSAGTRPGLALRHAVTAVDLLRWFRDDRSEGDWSLLRGRVDEWMAWAARLAMEQDSGDAATRIAELRRSDLVRRQVEADAARDGQGALGSLVSEFVEVQTTIGAAGDVTNDEVPEGDEDDDADGPSRGELRAQRARGARGRFTATGNQLGDLARLLPRVEADPGRSAGGTARDGAGSDPWFVWVELVGSSVIGGYREPGGRCVSFPVNGLSRRTMGMLLRLGDPVEVDKILSDTHFAMRSREFWGAMEELGSVIASGRLGKALSRATAVSPVPLEISPAGVMWVVPWAAVLVDGEPLVQRATVTLIASRRTAEVLRECRRRRRIDAPFVAFGTLPAGTREEEAVRELWPRAVDADIMTRADFGGGGMLLVSAVHGEENEGGLSRKLRLGDREVSASEMFSWRFPWLTCFGSCWLGRVDDTTAGPLGVSLPVLMGGARTFIAGLFSIKDNPTASILTRFYRSVSAGRPAASSLAASQRAWLADHPAAGRRPPNPSKWAGLVAIGVD